MFAHSLTYKTVWSAFFAALLLSSCSQDGGEAAEPVENTRKPMLFNASVDGQTSRGALLTELAGQFGLFATESYSGNEEQQTFNYINNEAVAKDEEGVWKTLNQVNSPMPGWKMNFYAYLPYQAATMSQPYFIFNGGESNYTGVPYFDFTINDVVEEQIDLMTAQNTGQSTFMVLNDSLIPLTFDHILAAVKFTIDASVQAGFVKKITIKQVPDGGVFKYDDTTDWDSLHTNMKDYSVNTEISSTATGENATQLAENKIFMMMPGELPEGAALTITLDDGQNTELTQSLAGKTWEGGKVTTYNIKVNSASGGKNKMSLTVKVSDWEDVAKAHYTF